MNDDLVELLADTEHKRWSSWHLYMVSKCISNDDGTLTIPKLSVDRWQRQATTHYKDLTEKEKESDRKEVRNTFDTILKFLRSFYVG